MIDGFQRKIEYMRISITDRCNLRCRYCMPDGIHQIPMAELLTYEDILAVCREAVSLGIRKYKITGGEPLVRKDCCQLIRRMYEIEGLEEVTLTTNGVLLENYLPELKEAGIRSINVSLDTLDPWQFEDITRFPQLDRVLKGIQLALDLGLKVKINCVLQKGRNDGQWKDIMELARERALHVRFIELMPIGDGDVSEGISNQELLEKMQSLYPDMEMDDRKHGNGPAIYYHIPGWQGSIGFISAIHGKFCDSCNRIRMTSTGDVKPCLCFEDSISIRQAARDRDREKIINILKDAIRKKPQMHLFEEIDKITERRKMAQIGG